MRSRQTDLESTFGCSDISETGFETTFEDYFALHTDFESGLACYQNSETDLESIFGCSDISETDFEATAEDYFTLHTDFESGLDWYNVPNTACGGTIGDDFSLHTGFGASPRSFIDLSSLAGYWIPNFVGVAEFIVISTVAIKSVALVQVR